ncbi:hypothetical protein PHYC_00926 [Phycisphaerales bacterium]|nr:hypothetical protein PHYC_00926 [Phycisphaerales bacterium]
MHRFFALTAVALVSPALGQVQNVAPYYAYVSQDRAPIHCNDSDRFYRVAEMTAGTVVFVDGEGAGWTRIAYPGGLSAFVRATDVTVQGEAATLSQPSRLKAANAASGYDGSYKMLFDTELPTGTALKVIEPVKDASGAIAAYKVAAPQGSKGFTPSRLLRRATDTEVAAFRAKPGVWLPDLPTTPAGTVAAKPPAAPGVTPIATPDATTPGSAPTDATPVEITQHTNPGTTPPAGTEPIVPAQPVQAAAPPERAVGTWDRLDASFQSVWKQPVLGAEFDELIAEFDRAIERSPTSKPGVKQQLESRRDALQIKREFRDKLRAQEEARARLDQDRVKVSQQLEEIARTRYYTIIGELQPSLVYDGKQLPQMYRVVSVGAAAPRTLGYLRQTDVVNLDDMLGQVIGVVGEAQLDRSLQLNIITPVHVDVLRSAAASNSTATVTPTATPADVPREK